MGAWEDLVEIPALIRRGEAPDTEERRAGESCSREKARRADLRSAVEKIRQAIADEDVDVVFRVDDYDYSLMVEAFDEGDGTIRLSCFELFEDAERGSVGDVAAKERYAAALDILFRDAGVTERDIDIVCRHADPLETLCKMRGRNFR